MDFVYQDHKTRYLEVTLPTRRNKKRKKKKEERNALSPPLIERIARKSRRFRPPTGPPSHPVAENERTN